MNLIFRTGIPTDESKSYLVQLDGGARGGLEWAVDYIQRDGGRLVWTRHYDHNIVQWAELPEENNA